MAEIALPKGGEIWNKKPCNTHDLGALGVKVVPKGWTIGNCVCCAPKARLIREAIRHGCFIRVTDEAGKV